MKTKIMVVDDVWATVGSVNLDDRSFHINDETNLNIWDAAFAAQLTAAFEADKMKSRALTLSNYKKRPLRIKIAETVAGWFRGLL